MQLLRSAWRTAQHRPAVIEEETKEQRLAREKAERETLKVAIVVEALDENARPLREPNLQSSYLRLTSLPNQEGCCGETGRSDAATIRARDASHVVFPGGRSGGGDRTASLPAAGAVRVVVQAACRCTCARRRGGWRRGWGDARPSSGRYRCKQRVRVFDLSLIPSDDIAAALYARVVSRVRGAAEGLGWLWGLGRARGGGEGRRGGSMPVPCAGGRIRVCCI